MMPCRGFTYLFIVGTVPYDLNLFFCFLYCKFFVVLFDLSVLLVNLFLFKLVLFLYNQLIHIGYSLKWTTVYWQ